MQVTLINPQLKTWSPNIYSPMGIAYIAARLEQDGHEVKIIDMNSHKISDRKLVKMAYKSDVIGIGGMITEYNEIVRLALLIKSEIPCTLILGGALATTHSKELFEETPADYIVIGEGERTTSELLEVLDNPSLGITSVKGIAYRSLRKDRIEYKGIYYTEPREPIQNLDLLEFPARHLLDMSKYTTHHFKTFGIKVPDIKSTTMITSRGCPYSCTYCFQQMWGKKWIGRSAQDIYNEIVELMDNYGMRGFVFNDDTFPLDKQRVMDFCDLLIKNRLDIYWYCNGRVNLMDEEMISAMAASGCKGIAYGIETGNPQMLKAIKKGITIDQVEKICRLTKKYGIHVTGYFMIGLLGDTRETIQETIDLAERLDLNFYGFNMASPIMGTEMYAQAVSQGLINDMNLEDWSFHASVNLTKDCTVEDLEHYNELTFRKFTLEKRWGKRYLLNYKLWVEGFRSLMFLLGKRNVKVLLEKVIAVLRRK